MKKVVFYCSGRNETAPLEIDGVHFYPDRASMWKELAGNHPDVSFSVYLPKTGEFIADMGGKITHASKRISYTFLSGNESVEEIAERIAAECPDAAVAFSIPILPYDWSSLRDAMVGEELRKRGIKTVAPSVKFALDSFEKNRLSDFLRRNGFHVAQNVLVQNALYHAQVLIPTIPQNVYREYVLRQIKNLHFPVIMKPTVFSGSDGRQIISDYEEIAEKLDKWNLNSDILIEEQIIGVNFGIEIYGDSGIYHVMDPVIFSAKKEGVTDPVTSIKVGPVMNEKYHVDYLKNEMLRMAKLCELSGIAQVDLIFSEGEWYIVEVNTRYTLMSEITALIQNKSVPDLLAEPLMDKRDITDKKEKQFACDFKTELLDEEEINRLREKYSCIASVMRLQTAVTGIGLVEYCEFVVVAKSKEELVNEMQKIREENCNLVEEEICKNLVLLLSEI